MTYMATLEQLIETDELVSLGVELEQNALPCRKLIGTPGFVLWLDEVLPQLQTTIVGGITDPLEQVDAVFHEYISGEDINYDRRFKRLTSRPDDRHVWELKTPDIRIFGWVPKKDHFICCYGEMKDEIELRLAYPRFIAQTVYVRTTLDLDEPKCIQSRDYNDVVST
ncbi:hypothetical protein F9K94_15440 [Brucella tritici]|uniref:Uncharacterized protein n=1 Tax=Brucella tritici TaxID=94626 RepID=A0A7V8B1D4_9HYPH|nr:hypothetical protein [Brucella tritici]KAB2655919.1 hypothetical protein F9K94_15440 [Brucella tritici]